MSSSKERDKAIIIAVAIIEKDSKLLMVQEGREDVRGKWNVPAGHANFGEDPVNAVKREAKEETGLDVEPQSLVRIHVFRDKDSGSLTLRFNIRCEVKGGKFEDQEGEILDIKWMNKEELKALKEQGELRSERTWLSIQDWLNRKESSLDLFELSKD